MHESRKGGSKLIGAGSGSRGAGALAAEQTDGGCRETVEQRALCPRDQTLVWARIAGESQKRSQRSRWPRPWTSIDVPVVRLASWEVVLKWNAVTRRIGALSTSPDYRCQRCRVLADARLRKTSRWEPT